VFFRESYPLSLLYLLPLLLDKSFYIFYIIYPLLRPLVNVPLPISALGAREIIKRLLLSLVFPAMPLIAIKQHLNTLTFVTLIHNTHLTNLTLVNLIYNQ